MVTLATQLIAELTIWERLTPLDKARLAMALFALLLLFVGVVAFVMMTAHIARREIRKPLPKVRDLTDAWAKRPLTGPSAGHDSVDPHSAEPQDS